MEKFNDKNAELKGKDLARKLHADKILSEFLLADIKGGNTSEANWNEYINVLFHLGKSLNLPILLKNKNTIPKTMYLNTLATVYKITDEPEQELQMLKIKCFEGHAP